MSVSTIIIRCDAWPDLGYGHLYRCMVLARILRDVHHQNVTFAVRPDEAGEAYIAKSGFETSTVQSELPEGSWLRRTCRQNQAGAVVLDVRSSLGRGQVEELRGDGVLTVVIDDGSDRRLAGDLVFMPPVPQVKGLSWDTFTGLFRIGFEWTLIDPPPIPLRWTPPGPEPRVLITMGGSDPAGLTFKAVSALEKVPVSMKIDVVVGPGFQRYDALTQLLGRTRKEYKIHRDVDDMYALMGPSDLALISFGHTAYELAAMGVPAVYLCLTDDHALSASAFVERAMGISMGCHQQVTAAQLAQCVSKVLSDHVSMRSMSEAGLEAMQGGGAARVAEMIMAHMAPSSVKKAGAAPSGSSRCGPGSNIESCAPSITQGHE